jgi:hypothetical protein
MTPTRRKHWQRRRAVRTIAADLYARQRHITDARTRLEVITELVMDARHEYLCAREYGTYMETQELQRVFLWLVDKRDRAKKAVAR